MNRVDMICCTESTRTVIGVPVEDNSGRGSRRLYRCNYITSYSYRVSFENQKGEVWSCNQKA
jgi:hypothetical protein